VNWGASEMPLWRIPTRIINSPVHMYPDKLSFMRQMQDDLVTASYIPPFSVNDPNQLTFPVMCRRILNGHSGAGIVVAETPEQLVNAPLYVQYIPKESEWRVHFFVWPDAEGGRAGHIVDIQRKIRDPNREPTNWKVRSHNNGFIYVRNDLAIPQAVQNAANAFLASRMSLDFGALDIIYNRKQNRAYILEVNTAPGLFGHTVQVYADCMRVYENER